MLAPTFERQSLILLLVASTAAILGVVYFLFYPAIVNRRRTAPSSPAPIVLASNDEEQKKNRKGAVSAKITQLSIPPILSIVIPAYEEEVRLPIMLMEAFEYLNTKNCRALADLISLRSDTTHKENDVVIVEWIVVNDGSKDNTSQACRDFVLKNTTTATRRSGTQYLWKLLVLDVNRGKGGAVQAGMLAATGEFCLMVDADGATAFGPGLEAVTARLVHVLTTTTIANDEQHRYPILLGSRAHLQSTTETTSSSSSSEDTVIKRSLIRSILMYVFHICVVVLIGANDVRDTQCGFKLLHRTSAATPLFRNLHLQRWAFDTELLFLATQLRYTLHEVVVPWHDVAGSKLNTSAFNLAMVSISMLRDMACVRLCYTLGLWKIRQKSD